MGTTCRQCIALPAKLQYEAAGRCEIFFLSCQLSSAGIPMLCQPPRCANKANPHTGSAHSKMHSKIHLMPKHFCHVLR